MGSKPLWYMEGHSVACFNYFREYLGIMTTQFGFGTPDYQAQSEMDGAFRNDERQASASIAHTMTSSKRWKGCSAQ